MPSHSFIIEQCGCQDYDDVELDPPIRIFEMETIAYSTILMFSSVNNFSREGYGCQLKRRSLISFDDGCVNQKNKSEYGSVIKSNER
ncbi:MAG: hypothetical protein EZS28_040530, partial [Streblomastix strix]